MEDLGERVSVRVRRSITVGTDYKKFGLGNTVTGKPPCKSDYHGCAPRLRCWRDSVLDDGALDFIFVFVEELETIVHRTDPKKRLGGRVRSCRFLLYLLLCGTSVSIIRLIVALTIAVTR